MGKIMMFGGTPALGKVLIEFDLEGKMLRDLSAEEEIPCFMVKKDSTGQHC